MWRVVKVCTCHWLPGHQTEQRTCKPTDSTDTTGRKYTNCSVQDRSRPTNAASMCMSRKQWLKGNEW